MGTNVLIDAIAAITTISLAGMRWWARAKIETRVAREVARRTHVSTLPPGSRIRDLGDRGITIEVGSRDGCPRA